jgi:hypothetical protein
MTTTCCPGLKRADHAGFVPLCQTWSALTLYRRAMAGDGVAFAGADHRVFEDDFWCQRQLAVVGYLFADIHLHAGSAGTSSEEPARITMRGGMALTLRNSASDMPTRLATSAGCMVVGATQTVQLARRPPV